MEIKIQSPLDMHIHFRQGDMLKVVAPLTAKYFSGGLIMPNLLPPVDTIEKLDYYTNEVNEITHKYKFEPYMTLFFRNYSEKELALAKDKIIGIKLYPSGVTTNSEGGVSEINQAEPTLKLMEEMGIRLLVHGETHGFVMDREKEFMSVYEHLAKKFPKLQIVMEHITTKDAVEMLDKYENLFATVTVHHLMITLDDVAGGLLQPHLFCKPIAKRPEDREALLNAALEAHPKLCFGSDSAPHPRDKKEAPGCAAGVFTAPISLQLLAEIFQKHNKLDNLQNFISENAQRIYKIDPPSKLVTLEDSGQDVPDKYSDVVPMLAGQKIKWKIKNIN